MKNKIDVHAMKNVTIKMVSDTFKSIIALASHTIGSFFQRPTLIQIRVSNELKRHGADPRALQDVSKYNFGRSDDKPSYRNQ